VVEEVGNRLVQKTRQKRFATGPLKMSVKKLLDEVRAGEERLVLTVARATSVTTLSVVKFLCKARAGIEAAPTKLSAKWYGY